jgi:hypothetical protein
MEKRCVFLISVLAVLPCAAGEPEERPVPVYTNEDLARVAPLRGETGVLSQPAVPPRPLPSERAAERPSRARGEDHWRREADRLRETLRPLLRRAASLKREIHERWKLPGVAPMTDPKLIEWRRELQEVEAEIRERQERLEERARRDGALPGWLR